MAVFVLGMTPACAGRTGPLPHGPAPTRDDPRLRGENVVPVRVPVATVG